MEQTKVPGGEALRTVFLDRDGVINEKAPEGEYIRRVQDLTLLNGAASAIARLNRAGVRVVVVTNQRGVALGLYTVEDVRKIEAALEEMLAAEDARVDGFYFCPHDEGTCNCRKPQPGLFEQARADFQEIDPASSVMIGDSLSDVEFGRGLDMRTIFIDAPAERQRSGAERARAIADMRLGALAEAVEYLLNRA
ncbi:MAG: D-glycero-alpha-D-manno-heptose-1,7-bisphosphate 7-phosphatase [Candidatus Binataceae bacterium]